MKYKSVEEMPVWKSAMAIAVEIFQISIDLPRCEDYGLTSQIRRSATSISANLAEGYGRSTDLDKRKFYIIARGSAYETINHLIYGTHVGYFGAAKADELIMNLNETIHDLNKLINFITIKPKPQSII